MKGAGSRFRFTAAQFALLAIIGSFLVTTLPWIRGERDYSPFVDGVWQNAAFAAAALLCAVRTTRTDPDRAAWIVLAIGLACMASGGTYWSWFVAGRDPEPFPTVADVLWVGFYACVLVTLLLLVASRTGAVALSFALDGLLVGLGAATMTAALILPAVLARFDGSVAEIALNLAYPVLDILLVAGVLAAAFLFRWRPPAGMWWLGAGLALSAVVDWTYLVEDANDVYISGGVVDAAFVLAATLLGLAPGRRSDSTQPRATSALPLTAPLLASGLAVFVMILDDYVEISPVASYLAAATAVGSMARLAVAFVDARRASENYRLARTDDLTGLPNRRGFYAAADDMLAGAGGAILLVDLDRFKDVNDSLGHLAGDELLCIVARRLRGALATRDMLARLGGDEFAVVVPHATAELAGAIATTLLTVVSDPVELDGLHVQVDASVGIAVSPEHGRTVATLMRHADIAMYRAKRQECGVQLYRTGELDPSGREITRAGMVFLEQLRTALAQRQLTVHYQPQVDMRTGRIVAVEALVRWNHPQQGLLYPGEFLPVVQQNGLMHKLTALVLAQALDDAARWRTRGFAIPVAVNLFPPSIGDGDLPERIAAELASRRLEPASVRVEITEDFLVGNLERARRVLDVLHDMGVQIAIDDFGTGYSALSYLRELPIDEVKLDRSFVVPIEADERSAAIVRAVIDLAATLNVTCVAEGVENAETYAALARYGCDVAQGYYCGRPMPVDDLLRELTSRAERTRATAG